MIGACSSKPAREGSMKALFSIVIAAALFTLLAAGTPAGAKLPTRIDAHLAILG